MTKPVVFLSASIPDAARDPKYHESADRIAIRDSVRALVSVLAGNGTLVWGGHPAITPLVRVVVESLGLMRTADIRLFQSALFAGQAPPDNNAFEKIVVVPAIGADRDSSLGIMRKAMLSSDRFDAGIFIGGMEGVEQEYELFREAQPDARRLPIASTGAAALQLYLRNREQEMLDSRLLDDFAYPTLFRSLLGIA